MNMESQEAIMENENNSNLECESINRERDQALTSSLQYTDAVSNNDTGDSESSTSRTQPSEDTDNMQDLRGASAPSSSTDTHLQLDVPIEAIDCDTVTSSVERDERVTYEEESRALDEPMDTESSNNAAEVQHMNDNSAIDNNYSGSVPIYEAVNASETNAAEGEMEMESSTMDQAPRIFSSNVVETAPMSNTVESFQLSVNNLVSGQTSGVSESEIIYPVVPGVTDGVSVETSEQGRAQENAEELDSDKSGVETSEQGRAQEHTEELDSDKSGDVPVIESELSRDLDMVDSCSPSQVPEATAVLEFDPEFCGKSYLEPSMDSEDCNRNVSSVNTLDAEHLLQKCDGSIEYPTEMTEEEHKQRDSESQSCLANDKLVETRICNPQENIDVGNMSCEPVHTPEISQEPVVEEMSLCDHGDSEGIPKCAPSESVNDNEVQQGASSNEVGTLHEQCVSNQTEDDEIECDSVSPVIDHSSLQGDVGIDITHDKEKLFEGSDKSGEIGDSTNVGKPTALTDEDVSKLATISPDGESVVHPVGESESNERAAISPDGESVLNPVGESESNERAAISPDGESVVHPVGESEGNEPSNAVVGDVQEMESVQTNTVVDGTQDECQPSDQQTLGESMASLSEPSGDLSFQREINNDATVEETNNGSPREDVLKPSEDSEQIQSKYVKETGDIIPVVREQVDKDICAEARQESGDTAQKQVSESGETLQIQTGAGDASCPAVPGADSGTSVGQNEQTSEITNTNIHESNTLSQSQNENDEIIETRNIKKEIYEEQMAETATGGSKNQSDMLRNIKEESVERANGVQVNDEDDVVILDDDGENIPVKKELLETSPSERHSGQKQSKQKTTKDVNTNEQGSPSKKTKSKMQTCIVCLKVCRCKYNIVRNGDIKHLCGDDCFKRFRKTPSQFLKNEENAKNASKPQPTTPSRETIENALNASAKVKTCHVCQLMGVNPAQPFCNWKGLDFCGEQCLGKFQASLNNVCSFCRCPIPPELRSAFCLKVGNDMRLFCQQRCHGEFKKALRLCACCQKDLSTSPGSFSALVGTLDKKIRQFCSQACLKKTEKQILDMEVVSRNSGQTHIISSNQSGATAICSVCQKIQTVRHTVRLHGKVNRLCSDVCLSAFQYTNKIGMAKCDNCGTMCTTEEAQAHCVQFEGSVKRFCSDICVNHYRLDNSKVMPCGWCAAKKVNFDMIERLDAEKKLQLFCSLNCLSFYRVNVQAKSNQAVPCDHCRTVTPAQYHLTMSDASVRNFCSYACVMTFQAQFTQRPPTQTITSPPKPQQSQQAQVAAKTPQAIPKSKSGRANTKQAAAAAIPLDSSSFPVISSVVSLAPPGQAKEPPTPKATTPNEKQPATMPSSNPNALSSGDGKHQIIIQAPPVKPMRNKSLQCRPVSLTKATSCRPHSIPKEIQTDKIPDKQVMVPIPVPIYIPMPTAMYSAPTPILIPVPIPIPVPVFIPTTRKSIAGIMKTITEIVERTPADPLEAELLMMAEALTDKKVESEESEEEDFGDGFDESEVNVSAKDDDNMNKTEGEEDMIQMALRMAEEMSGPIHDLETSVEAVAVKSDPPLNQQLRSPEGQGQVQVFQMDEDYMPPGTGRGRGRGGKRPARGRQQPPQGPGRPKRQRTERYSTYNDDISNSPQQIIVTPQPEVPQQVEPAPDASYRLKFTYGVNAWRHWVIAKNAQIESTQTPSKESFNKVRTFPTDILKCTTDQLNFSLMLFIQEVRKPNGEEYSPDSIYYLNLGIQQYLYENGRIDSIFTDGYFEKFSDSLHELLKNLQPKVNSQGQMLCRIEEEHLWESKQLGAHSPFVLLNTLIYFHTKHFILKTAQDHMSLSFAQILKHWKKGVPLKGQPNSGKNISLRYYCLANGRKENSQSRKQQKEGVPMYEITENFENPLRCPVKLYEFFLSKCPESIKNRNDIFYPVPERSCVPDSPVWYSTLSIGQHAMDKMLTRVLLVREIQEAHLHAQPIYL